MSAQFLEQDGAEHNVAVLPAFAVLNVHDHASAVDIADLQARELGAAHAGAVEGHQNGAIEGSRRSLDELCYFFLTENGGQAIALLGRGSVGNAPGPLERLDVEEAQGAEMVGHRTGSQFVHGEELGMVLADVLRSQPIGRAVEVLGEPLDQANVTRCGSLRVMPWLYCLQHLFAQMGHRDTSLRPQLSEPKIRTADITYAAASAAPAA